MAAIQVPVCQWTCLVSTLSVAVVHQAKLEPTVKEVSWDSCFSLDCNTGLQFRGIFALTTADPCISGVCLNGGVCMPYNDEDTTYSCSCTSGCSGKNCASCSACNSLNCLNGGTCSTNPLGQSFCQCPSNYAGSYCQICKLMSNHFQVYLEINTQEPHLPIDQSWDPAITLLASMAAPVWPHPLDTPAPVHVSWQLQLLLLWIEDWPLDFMF